MDEGVGKAYRENDDVSLLFSPLPHWPFPLPLKSVHTITNPTDW